MIGYYVPVFVAPHSAWRPAPADVPREMFGPYAASEAKHAIARIDGTWHAEWGGVAVTGEAIAAASKDDAWSVARSRNRG